MKSQNDMYKHSFGHCKTQTEAARYMKQLEEEYPNKKLHVVYENRSRSKWMKYCVCEFIPFKRDKGKVKKSNSKGSNRPTHKHTKVKFNIDIK